MLLKDYHEKLRPFVFHGVDLNNDDKEARGDCPFCGKQGHFFVKTQTGQWKCHKCDFSGNIYTFLQMLLDQSLAVTNVDELSNLAKDRKIPLEALKAYRVTENFITGEWIIPTYNDKGAISNLYKYVEIDGRMRLLGTPTCNVGLFGLHLLTKETEHIRLCEGPWDAMALHGALAVTDGKGRLTKQYIPPKEAVLAVPGAGSFQESWLPIFVKKKVDIMFDNDHPKKDDKGNIRLVKGKPIRPGWDGQQRLISLIKSNKRHPSKLNQLMWAEGGHDSERADGYDVRDLIAELGPAKALAFIKKNLHKVKLEKTKDFNSEQTQLIEPIERTSFDQLCEDFESVLHFSTNLRDTLCVMLAVVASTDLKGDQLWLKVIGPPGSGKTTLAEAVSAAREYCMPKSIMTGFHSGYTANGTSSKDSSLIPEMRGKCVIIKDADTVIQAPNRDKIMSELRDIYDGTSRAHYRNEKKNEYEDIRTTFILCGTDELRRLNSALLGERFLDCEIMSKGQDDKPYLESALQNTYNKLTMSLKEDTPANPDDALNPDMSLFLQQVTYGYLQHLKQTLRSKGIPTLSEEAADSLEAMARFLSIMRARVRRDGYDMTYRPRPELATRIVSQLVKLAVCVALVLDRPSVDSKVLSLVRKIVRDTAMGFQLDITEALAEEHRDPRNMSHKFSSPEITLGGMNIRQLCSAVNLPETNVRRILNDMQELGMVERRTKNNRSGQRGRDVHIWKLTDSMMSLYVSAMMFGAPVPTPKPRPQPKRKSKVTN